jgi:hypothetical protein
MVGVSFPQSPGLGAPHKLGMFPEDVSPFGLYYRSRTPTQTRPYARPHDGAEEEHHNSDD